MALSDREWRLVPEETHPGPTNMALDAVAAETAASGGPLTLRVYRWEPSALSLGYGQASETVDWEYCERAGIDVTRRPTGGGGIYHDAFGDVSYSIAVPADEVPGDLMQCYSLLLEPVLDALGRMGIAADVADQPRSALYRPACYLREVHPAHDVVVSGRKISGNAQHRTREAVIQHGSITYARETDRHLAVFDGPGVGADEFEARVTSVRHESGVDREEAVGAVEDALAAWADAHVDGWTAEELQRADDLVEERFADEGWVHRR